MVAKMVTNPLAVGSEVLSSIRTVKRGSMEATIASTALLNNRCETLDEICVLQITNRLNFFQFCSIVG